MNGYLGTSRPHTWEDSYDSALGDFALLRRQAEQRVDRMTPAERKHAERWLKQQIAKLPESKRRMVDQIMERSERQGWTKGQLNGLGSFDLAAGLATLATVAKTGLEIHMGLEARQDAKRAQRAQIKLAQQQAAREQALFEQQLQERKLDRQRQQQAYEAEQEMLRRQLELQEQQATNAGAQAGIPPGQTQPRQPGLSTGAKVGLAAAAAGGAALLLKG